jgi:flagellar basal-body rod protein FlgB
MRTLFDSTQGLERALQFQRDRQEILSENVANLATPGFVPRDLEADPAATEFRALLRTHAAHLPSQADSPADRAVDRADRAPGADGNSVSLELQMAKLNATRVQFGAAASLVSRKLALLRYGASDGNG